MSLRLLAAFALALAAAATVPGNRSAEALALYALKVATAARGGRELQASCSGYSSCTSCAGSASCKWCVGSQQCLLASSSACPTSNAYLPGDCSCTSTFGCSSCVNADASGLGCLYCDSSQSCMPIMDGKCSSYSFTSSQCSGSVPHSSPGSCSGQTGCASCTSASSICGFCVVPSVGCVDMQGIPRCGTSAVIISGCGGTSTSNTVETVSASFAIIRGIAIFVGIIFACCAICFRDRLRACCCSGDLRSRSTGNAVVQQNPFGSPPTITAYMQSPLPPGYASYVQPQLQQPGSATYTQPRPQQAQAFAPSNTSKQQPPPLSGPEPFARVAAVTPGSPADVAGLRIGDALISLCGAREFTSVGSCLGAAETLGAAPPSQILRGGVSIALFIQPRKGAGLGAVIEEV